MPQDNAKIRNNAAAFAAVIRNLLVAKQSAK